MLAERKCFFVFSYLAISHTDVTNEWGETPVDVAKKKGHNKVADYIINYAKGEQKPNSSIYSFALPTLPSKPMHREASFD